MLQFVRYIRRGNVTSALFWLVACGVRGCCLGVPTVTCGDLQECDGDMVMVIW